MTLSDLISISRRAHRSPKYQNEPIYRGPVLND